MKKYLCIEGTIEIPKHLICPPIQYDPEWKMPTTKIEAEWLSRWYKVPYDECIFAPRTDYIFHSSVGWHKDMIELTYRPDGDYEEHLKILKTERLFQL